MIIKTEEQKQKNREAQKRWRLAHPEKVAALHTKCRKARKANGTYIRFGNRTAQNIRYYQSRKLVLRAHRKLNKAVISGKIVRPEICSRCGSGGIIMGHHDNYEKPLDVIWVCWMCHEEIHGGKHESTQERLIESCNQ